MVKIAVDPRGARLKELYEDMFENENVEDMQNRLMRLERRRSWLLWHDHSGIRNQGLMLFLLRELYDPVIYLTDSEFLTKHGIAANVQSQIEEPQLYMMGMAGSSNACQLAFIPTRRECLRGMSQPIEINGIKINDCMRFMNGDSPSVEFEDGTQKCGHHGCCGCDGDIRRADEYDYMAYRRYKCLEEKRNLIFEGPAGKKGGLHPYQKLKVNEVRAELRARGEDETGLKPELQEKLAGILGGQAEFQHCYSDVSCHVILCY